MCRDDERRVPAETRDMVEAATGLRPTGYNCNWLRRGPHTLSLLKKLGCAYHIDDGGRDEPFTETVGGRDFVVVPYTLRNNDILLIEGRNYSPTMCQARTCGPKRSTSRIPRTSMNSARAGQFDHVVISAANTATGPVRAWPLADAQVAMDSKFWGAYRIARAIDIAPGGSLTFVSAYLSVRLNASSVLQGAINAALEALACGLALELAPVRVNTVSPGLIATPLWDKLAPYASDAMYAGAAQRLPERRVGQPEDVAHAILYLAATPYATGSTALIDGGGAIA